MAGAINPAAPGRDPNPQFLFALFLVGSVRQQVASFLPQAFQTGSAAVSGDLIQRWEAELQGAVQLIQQVPAPLIFPPPQFVTFANAAVTQIEAALALLASIPVASPLIFPPQPGQALIPAQTLFTLLNQLQQAERDLFFALQTS